MRRDLAHHFTALWLLSMLSAVGCDMPFYPEPLINTTRILAVRAVGEPTVDDLVGPEICPFGVEDCPDTTAPDTVRISLLAADQNGVIADGDFPDGSSSAPYLKDGFKLTWGICTYFATFKIDEPDCTRGSNAVKPETSPVFRTTGAELLAIMFQIFADTLAESGAATGFDASTIDPSTFDPETSPSQAAFRTILDQLGRDDYPMRLGVAIEPPVGETGERRWAVKGVTLSERDASGINTNPRLRSVTLGGVPVVYGESFAEVETGFAYEILYEVPPEDRQEIDVATTTGTEKGNERIVLRALTTAGAVFDSDGAEQTLEIWQDPERKLFWRAPLDVPEDGLEVSLFFIFADGRGGQQWTWGKVFVKRGGSVYPH